MSGFIAGADRHQATLFPEFLDEYITEESSVRVIDVFVDELDLMSLGFKTLPADTGRPGYHPALMLKLFIYGYLNRVQSSHRLEREAQRNVELMWLTGKLAPDFKTIADFRKDHGSAIQRVCREFVVLCRKLELFKDAFVAIDGSKFKALNNRDKNFTKAKVQRRLEQIDESIARYLAQMESLDRQESEIADDKTQRLSEKIAKLKEELAKLKKHEAAMLAAPDEQLSLTDPDARSMATSGRGTGLVGYNVQVAVDTKHHFIVAHEVTNLGHDRTQLAPMSERAKAALGVDQIEVVADRGYFSGEQIKSCEEAAVTTYLPKPETSGNMAKGYFGKRDFIYKPDDDEYECPAGERAIYRFTRVENDKQIRRYWSSACTRCALKPRCTNGEYRRISRWEPVGIDALKEQLAGLDLDDDVTSKIVAEVASVEAQVSSPKPKQTILREGLASLRNILEGAGGGVAAELSIQLGQILGFSEPSGGISEALEAGDRYPSRGRWSRTARRGPRATCASQRAAQGAPLFSGT